MPQASHPLKTWLLVHQRSISNLAVITAVLLAITPSSVLPLPSYAAIAVYCCAAAIAVYCCAAIAVLCCPRRLLFSPTAPHGLRHRTSSARLVWPTVVHQD